MKRHLFPVMFLSIIFLLSSCHNTRTDSEIEMDITNKLADKAESKNLKASVSDGKVTLTGTCVSQSCANDCADEVKAVEGVKEVVNNIRVAQVPGEEAPVEIATDDILTKAVNELVAGYHNVKAEVKEGVVILKGEIDRSELKGLMENINALKVKKVDNQLIVK